MYKLGSDSVDGRVTMETAVILVVDTLGSSTTGFSYLVCDSGFLLYSTFTTVILCGYSMTTYSMYDLRKAAKLCGFRFFFISSTKVFIRSVLGFPVF
jgi:hypothetical protein